MHEQLLLFGKSKEQTLEEEVQMLKEQCEKVRKSQFAKITELMNLYVEIKNDLDTLKANSNT